MQKITQKRTNAAGTTVLFALPVRGVGTGEVESLTSYVRRLAEAHVVGASWLAATLANAGGDLERLRHGDCSRYGEALCGRSRTSVAIVNALIEQTGRSEIAHTTFLDRVDGLDIQKALRRYRAWCPACLALEQPYDRLMWTLADSKTCAQHGRSLVDTCGACGSPHLPLHPRARSLHCAFCGNSLADSSVGRQTGPTTTERRLRELVAYLEAGHHAGPDEVRGAITLAVTRDGSLRETARHHRLSKSSVYAYVSGRTRPSLLFLLRMIDPADSLAAAFSKPVVARPALGRGGRPPSRAPSKRMCAAMTRLSAALLGPDEELPAVRHFALKYRISQDSLRLRAPDQVQQLVARRRAHQAARRGADELAREAQVRAAVRSVFRRDGRITRRAVQRELARPGLLRAPYLSAAYRDERERLEAS